MTKVEATDTRLDTYLSTVRLIRPRGQAKRACDNGIVYVDDRQAKPSTSVRAGSEIEIRFTDQILKLRVLSLPGKSVRKQDADSHYEVLEDKRFA